MWDGMIQASLATLAFAALHSLLASLAVKRLAARVFGERNRNGLYRAFFVAQSLVAFAALVWFLDSLPAVELYRIEPPLLWLTYALQASALLYTTWAVAQVGAMRISGLSGVGRRMRGGPVPPEPEAQGPALDAEGLPRRAGPFAWSRHPLNMAPLVALWLWPTMTSTFLAFNLTTTVYLVVGSFHEEARLRAAYGDAYAAYQRSGVPFYLPWPTRRASRPTHTLTGTGGPTG